MRAKRWNYRTKKFEPYELPKGAVVMAGLNDVVQCACCRRPVRYGDTRSSVDIRTDSDVGYAVCPECSTQEALNRLWFGGKQQ